LGLTSIFNAATAIFGVLVAAIVFGDERLTFNRGIGVIIGFAGVVVAIGPENLTQFYPMPSQGHGRGPSSRICRRKLPPRGC